jgi:hypothetical protein
MVFVVFSTSLMPPNEKIDHSMVMEEPSSPFDNLAHTDRIV